MDSENTIAIRSDENSIVESEAQGNGSSDMDAISLVVNKASDSSMDDTVNGKILVSALGEQEAILLAKCVSCNKMPLSTYYRCGKDHLLCGPCYSKTFSKQNPKSSRGKCPNCAKLIVFEMPSDVVDKTMNHLSQECLFCGNIFMKDLLKRHQGHCSNRITKCRYSLLGCTWEDCFSALNEHEEICEKRNWTGDEVLDTVTNLQSQQHTILRGIANLFFDSMSSNFTIRKPPLKKLIPNEFLNAGVLRAKGFKWLVDIIWRPKNEAFNAKSTIAYRIKLMPKNRKIDKVNLQYTAIKMPYCAYDVNAEVNFVKFDSKCLVSPESVYVVSSTDYCSRLLSHCGVNMRICSK